jgi:hypothetical protein
MVVFSGISSLVPTNAKALSGSDFKAGRIIDDAVFFNKNAMSVDQIQQFLNAKVPTCDRNRQTYFTYAGKPYGPPFTCLKEYQENPITKENNIGRFNPDGTPYNVPGGKTAAQIIWDAAQTHNINPQSLIVTLQKETAIVTDTWAAGWQYDRAMGYGCPDSGPNNTANCNANYYGFYNQVNSAAWQFRRYVTYPDKYNFKAGVTRFIGYNPSISCGGSNIFIENSATAALYNYTPYQPNAGALANLYGTAPCGAYGNRNFWRLFHDWFGSPYILFESFAQPRWMQLNTNVYKISAITLQQVDEELLQGRQIKFASKVWLNNQWCYRTQHDTDNFLAKCIPASKISELNIIYTPLDESEKFKAILQNTSKVELRTDKLVMPLEKNRQINFDSKISIGGREYYISSQDKANGIEYGVLSARLRPTRVYENIDTTWYKINKITQKLIPSTLQPQDSPLQSNLEIAFASRVNVGGRWYYRTQNDTRLSLDKAIPPDYLDEIKFIPFINPRVMELSRDTYKQNPYTVIKVDSKLPKGQDIRFVEKLTIRGKTYYRTHHDTTNGLSKAIPAEDVWEVPALSFTQPRWILVKNDANKIVARTGESSPETVIANTQYRFTSKMNINSTTYFRIEEDTQAGEDYWISSYNTEEIKYEPMVAPRALKLKEDLRKKIPSQEQDIDGTLLQGRTIFFKDKISVNGVTYLRTAFDSNLGYNKGIELSKLE